MIIDNIEPQSFTAGETVKWKRYLAKYPPNENWTLSYSFRGLESKLNIEAIADSDHYLITLTSERTAAFTSGEYRWQATVTREEERYFIGEGNLIVKPNLLLLDCYDGRSHVKKVLDALEATILGKASRDQLSYSISGRSLSRLAPTELLKWRDLYKAEYTRMIRQDRLNQGIGNDQTIKIRFKDY